MAPPPTKEVIITGQKRHELALVKITQDFPKIQPFWPSHLSPDLLGTKAGLPENLHLLLWNIMIEQNHAAVFVVERTSRTIPLRLKATASRTASAEITSRYS